MAFSFDKTHHSVVIGSNGAIGSACVKALKKSGANVFEIDLIKPNNHSPENFIKCDITNFEDIRECSNKINKIDSLIYTAGINYDANIIDIDWNKYRKVMSVNLDGAFKIASIFGKKMMKNNSGSFVFFSSMAGLKGESGASVYCASKFGLIGFVESFAAEMTSFNVRVNAICPGNVDSPMLKQVASAIALRKKLNDDDVLNEMKFAGAAKRLVDVNEVANLAIYLCSNLSSGITGSILKVDCGASLDA